MFENPMQSISKTPLEKLTVKDIEEHFQRNTHWELPFFKPCPSCKSINTGIVGCAALGLGDWEDSICVKCGTRFDGRCLNYIQREYLQWLLLNDGEEAMTGEDYSKFSFFDEIPKEDQQLAFETMFCMQNEDKN